MLYTYLHDLKKRKYSDLLLGYADGIETIKIELQESVSAYRRID